MFIQQLLVPAFALLGVAAAQTNTACSTKSITINSNADFVKYASCPDLQSLTIGSEAGPEAIDISGPTRILGDLVVRNNSKMITLQSTSLASIAGTFNLNDVTALSTLSFSVLTSVKSIDWAGLPVLGSLTFPQTISSADSVVITNTFIESLNGINLKKVALLDINNNGRLTEFETQVANISQGLNIAGNSKNLIVSFPNLIWANNMTFRDVKGLKTPSLASINGSLIFVNNVFSEYIAPNLTSIGNFATSQGSFAFVGNNNLKNISFPLVTSIGGAFQVANNSALDSITMKALNRVGGAIDLSGNFSTPVAPALKNVVGALNIQSTAEIDCATYWNTLAGSIVQGKSNCVSKTADPTTLEGTTGTTTSSGSKSSSTKGAAASFGISEAAAGLSVIGGLLQLLM